tara:strand:- start:8 stop:658 length:651 start_codon:yes stop_codon:yes gene_type:complete
LSFEQYFSTAYREVAKNYFPLLIANFVFILLYILSFALLVGLVIWPAITVASVHYILNYARKGNADIGSSLSQAFKKGAWLRIWPFAIVYVLAICFGLIVLIIPGIYLAYRYAYSAYFIIDQDSEPFVGMSESAKLLHGIGFWKIFGVLILTQIFMEILLVIPVIGWIGVILISPFVWYITALPYINWTNNSKSNSDRKNIKSSLTDRARSGQATN